MNYEGQICRPPMEKSSFMLAVAVGCAYNRCRFCTLFKHLRYRELPLSQIEDELRRVQDMGANPSQVFLGDGNAFGMDQARLLAILSMVHKYFPACQMVNMDATVTDISNKTDAELRELKEAGVCHLYLGIESGLDDVLSFMHKDHDIAAAYQQISRLQAAGLVYDAHMMTGIAGHGRGLENAEQLAEFFNRTKPQRIINFSLFLDRRAPLYQDIKKGNFVPADELENLQEEYRLLSLLVSDSLYYDGFHDFLELRIRGTLPQDKEKMLQKLTDAITYYSGQEKQIAYA